MVSGLKKRKRIQEMNNESLKVSWIWPTYRWKEGSFCQTSDAEAEVPRCHWSKSKEALKSWRGNLVSFQAK